MATRDDQQPGHTLTAVEAADRLGVKRATLYAYVSRGLLDRVVATDGRTSLFDAGQVDAMRTDRRRSAPGELTTTVTSAITHLSEAGHAYRGTPVSDLVHRRVPFAEVADLLWSDHGRWTLDARLAAQIQESVVAVPSMPAFDRFRMAIALASASDPRRGQLTGTAIAAAGRTCIMAMVASLPMVGGSPGPVDDGGITDIAVQLWPRLSDEPFSAERGQAVNTALVVLADHGLATSTYAVRVAMSVRTDPYAAVAVGLGALGGALHGSVSMLVHELFERAQNVGAVEAVGERLQRGEHIPGFGHLVYAERDGRMHLLLEEIERAWPNSPRLEVALQVIEETGRQVRQPANIDVALGALSWVGGLGPAASGVFGIARAAGWLAHATEEVTEKPLRFRPVARYHAAPNDPVD